MADIQYCETCKYQKHSNLIGNEYYCTKYHGLVGNMRCENGEPRMRTNADRIRAMSDEELSSVFLRGCRDRKCPGMTPNPITDDACGKRCYECILQWLKSPAEGEA